jgi:hypothetical protein
LGAGLGGRYAASLALMNAIEAVLIMMEAVPGSPCMNCSELKRGGRPLTRC